MAWSTAPLASQAAARAARRGRDVWRLRAGPMRAAVGQESKRNLASRYGRMLRARRVSIMVSVQRPAMPHRQPPHLFLRSLEAQSVPTKSLSGGDLFIVDNSDTDWKVQRYIHAWAEIASKTNIATGYFEIGALLALDGQWQKLDELRILMGDEVSRRPRQAMAAGVSAALARLNSSIEEEKKSYDFLTGVEGVVDGLRGGTLRCRVYNKEKFHAKAYINHARQAVIGSAALVGSSNFTFPGLTGNVEINVQIIKGREVELLQEAAASDCSIRQTGFADP